jgi:hypothetical protein
MADYVVRTTSKCLVQCSRFPFLFFTSSVLRTKTSCGTSTRKQHKNNLLNEDQYLYNNYILYIKCSSTLPSTIYIDTLIKTIFLTITTCPNWIFSLSYFLSLNFNFKNVHIRVVTIIFKLSFPPRLRNFFFRFAFKVPARAYLLYLFIRRCCRSFD